MALPRFPGNTFVHDLLDAIEQLTRHRPRLDEHRPIASEWITAQHLYDLLAQATTHFARHHRFDWKPDSTYLYEWTMRDVAVKLLDLIVVVHRAKHPEATQLAYNDIGDVTQYRGHLDTALIVNAFILCLNTGIEFPSGFEAARRFRSTRKKALAAAPTPDKNRSN